LSLDEIGQRQRTLLACAKKNGPRGSSFRFTGAEIDACVTKLDSEGHSPKKRGRVLSNFKEEDIFFGGFDKLEGVGRSVGGVSMVKRGWWGLE
jgi:hypothetical protein